MAPPLSFAPWRERISAFSFPRSGTQRCPHLSTVTQQGWSQDPGLGLLIQDSAHRPHPPASGPVTPLLTPAFTLPDCLLGLRGVEEWGLMFPEAHYMLGTLPSSKSQAPHCSAVRSCHPTEQRRKLRLREAECLRSQAGKWQSWDLNSCSHGRGAATSGTLIWAL